MNGNRPTEQQDMTHKLACQECSWFGYRVLVAPHPFAPDEKLYGCPECLGIELTACCDEPECGDVVTCGTPTPNGYRNTCSAHAPKESK